MFNSAEGFSDEKDLLLRFKEIICKIDPDIITGWNVIDFDMKILKERFGVHKIEFKLGRIDWECKLRLSESFFVDSDADIPGRVVLDGIHLTKVSFIKLPDYKLSTASKVILGDDKTISSTSRWQEIEKYYKENPQKLIDYNLKDAELAYNIVKKSNMIELTIKRSMLTRMQLDRVNASIASFDSLYLKELQKIGVVASTAIVNESDERIKGGYVMEPNPGIYDYIVVLDFKSLYPSIIRTFNIDPLDHISKKDVHKYKSSEIIKSPNGAFFKNAEGILPKLIKEISEQRELAKRNKDLLGSNAIKILMNSLFGVIANPACRFYSLDIANAITHFGQFLIKLSSNKIKELNYDVVYGDTDSIFVNLHIDDYGSAMERGKYVAGYINSFLMRYIRKEYDRESHLELEFEKVFKKLLLPKMRGELGGAKKRYAGIIERDGKDVIDFTGMEFIRRDWTEVAKKFQQEILMMIFRGEKVEDYVKGFVEDIKAGKYDELLVYKKAIRKSVDSYTKTTPPHIQAARKIGRLDVGIIEYYQTVNGPETVESRKSKIDYEHYIEKQIKPIADSVLVFFNKSFDELVKGCKQYNLLEF
ncbi:MAG: DNA polymerase II [Nanoarchaeota archaeon]